MLNGELKQKVENSKVHAFHDVKIWFGQDHPHEYAHIKDLVYSNKGTASIIF